MLDMLTWDVWLGIGSGLLLVVGLLMAAAHRTEGSDGYGYDGVRRHEPMPLYEEGGAS